MVFKCRSLGMLHIVLWVTPFYDISVLGDHKDFFDGQICLRLVICVVIPCGFPSG